MITKINNRRRSRNVSRDGKLALLLLGIPLAWWIVISAFPLLFGLLLGFFEWNGLSAVPKFNGLQNYLIFFSSDLYFTPLIRSFTIGGLCFLATTIIGFSVAILLNSIFKFQGFFRTLWYIPVVTSSVATSQIFNILLDQNNGVINNILISFGKEPVMWILNENWAVFWIVVYSAWKGLGTTALLCLAGLQSVDKSLLEASRVDGAGGWKSFWNITIPQMSPILIYVAISGFSASIQIYEQVLFITNGGPFGKTEVLAFRIMKDAFWDNNFGMAGASSIIMTFSTFIFALLIFRSQRETVK
jgi:multiple sugar transport system permease protein